MSDQETKKKRRTQRSKDADEMEDAVEETQDKTKKTKKTKKPQVSIKIQHGETRSFDVEGLNARTLEEDFQMVRTHLEGSDHTVRFPNHETGVYEKLDINVIYTIYGHPYNADEIWKPRKTLPQRSNKEEMVEINVDEVVLDGRMKKLTKKFFGRDTWDEFYFVLKYPELTYYKNKGDPKPVKTMELRVDKAGSDKDEKDDAKKRLIDESIDIVECSLFKDVDNAFIVHTSESEWIIQAPNYGAREQWMSWIRATGIFDPVKWAAMQEKKKAKEPQAEGTKKKKRNSLRKSKDLDAEKEEAKESKEEMEVISLEEKKKKKASKREDDLIAL